MNEITRNQGPQPTDDDVLAAVHRKMSRVEGLVPLPPAWQPGGAEGAGGYRVRSRIGVAGGFAALVVVAAVLVIALGPIGRFGTGPAGPGGTAPGNRTFPPGSTAVSMLLASTRPGGEPTPAELEQTASILRDRLTAAGEKNAQVVVDGPRTVIVDLPQGSTIEATVLLGRGVVEFVPLPPATYGTNDAPGSLTAEDGKALPTNEAPLFDGSSLEAGHSNACRDQSTAAWAVCFTLRDPGRTLFAQWSAAHNGEFFAITLDGLVLSAPYVAAPVTDGNGLISGGFSQAQCLQIAAVMASGPLPLDVASLSMVPVGPDGTLPSHRLPAGSPAVSATAIASGATHALRIEYRAATQPTAAQLDETAAILRARLAGRGVTGAAVEVQVPDRIVVTLPPVSDAQGILQLAGQTGLVQFVPLPKERYGTVAAPGPQQAIEGQPLPTKETALFDGASVVAASASKDQGTGGSAILLVLNGTATAAFAAYTQAHVDEYFAVVLDGKVLTAPYVQAAIMDGKVQIGVVGGPTAAADLAALLRYGALPVPLQVVVESEVPAPSAVPS